MKWTMLDRLIMVKQYLDENQKIEDICRDFNNYDKTKLKYYIQLYQLHGKRPFSDEQEKRVYTREEKLNVIQQVMRKEKSSRLVALELGAPNPGVVHDWVKMYKVRGEDSIQVSSGRKSYKLHEDRQKYLAAKELTERLEYLEAENAYLKKVFALVLEKSKRLKKK